MNSGPYPVIVEPMEAPVVPQLDPTELRKLSVTKLMDPVHQEYV